MLLNTCHRQGRTRRFQDLDDGRKVRVFRSGEMVDI
jgi:hypothetical protein